MSKIKDTLKAYKEAAYNAAAEIDHIREIYREQEADRLITGVKDRLQAMKAEADAIFDADIEAGNKRAAEWARLDGNQITADAKLLDFDIDPGEYAELIDRYKDNATMSKLLLQYGEKKNAAAAADQSGSGQYYDTHMIPTRETKAVEYAAEARQAREIANRITLEPGYMSGVGSPMTEAAYNQFMGGN